MKKRSYTRYSPEFKEKAVQKAIESGNTAQTARVLGVSYGVLNSWLAADKKRPDKSIGLADTISHEQEIRKLKKENDRLQLELEIIKKAAAYFAQDELKKNTPRSRN